MKARDVLADCLAREVKACGYVAGRQSDALLAATPDGEGVYLAPDGTLMRVYPVNAYNPDRDDPDDYDRNVYALVPIEGADRD